MRGIKEKDLVALVDFMYHGETNIFQDDLDVFLALAEDLHLKGLAGSDLDIEQLSTKPQISRNPEKYVTKEDTKQFQHFLPSLHDSPFDEFKTKTRLVLAKDENIIVSLNDSMDNHNAKLESMMERNTDGDTLKLTWKDFPILATSVVK